MTQYPSIVTHLIAPPAGPARSALGTGACRSIVGLLICVTLAAVGGCATRAAPRTSRTPTLAQVVAGSSPTAGAAAAVQTAAAQVAAAERAFAATMARRDFKAFLTFLSPDAIFFSGNTVQRGPAQIATQWAPYFEERTAPFAWRPDDVQVLADGKLALSTGPLIQNGSVVGRFNSIWRLEAPNTWRIVFDKGEAVCATPPAPQLPQMPGIPRS